MPEAIAKLKANPVFNYLVSSTLSMTEDERNEVLRCIGVIKSTIIANAFTETDGEDSDAFIVWPALADWIDVLMSGISNA